MIKGVFFTGLKEKLRILKRTVKTLFQKYKMKKRRVLIENFLKLKILRLREPYKSLTLV